MTSTGSQASRLPRQASKLFQQSSRLISCMVPSGRKLKKVCGLLGPTNLGFGAEHWMATDFIALRELIGARDKDSIWLSSVPIPKTDVLLGDPGCDRIKFADIPDFETIHPLLTIRQRFTNEVFQSAKALSEGDILVLVLVGHGLEDGVFLINEEPFRKADLELCVQGSKGIIWLISTACYSGAWTSPCWWLLAASGPDEMAPSICISNSNKCRGGFFVNSLIAEHADEYGPIAPCSGSVDDEGNRTNQHPHDFHKFHVQPCRPSHRRSLCEVKQWIHDWRDKIGRAYTSANIHFYPCPSTEPHKIPFRRLDSSDACLHKFQCFPPSQATEPSSSFSESGHGHQTLQYPSRHNQKLMMTSLSQEDEDKLLNLANFFLQHKPPETARDIPTIIRCCALFDNRETVTIEEKSQLLENLINRRNSQELALAIARNLGWSEFVEQVGTPEVEQGFPSAMKCWQTDAEKLGCITSVVGHWPQYDGAAAWLSRVWDAAGRPRVFSKDWQSAVLLAQSQIQVNSSSIPQTIDSQHMAS